MPPDPNLPNVTLYTRLGCCLCEDAKRVLDAARHHARFALEIVNIDLDPHLRILFSDEVPVIVIDGRKAFKYRVTEEEFLKKLRART